MGVVVKTLAVLAGFLVVADVLGVVLSTIFDLAPIRGASSMLPYAIWLVLGIFCGLLSFGAAASWATGADPGEVVAPATGARIFWTGTAFLAALCGLFWLLWWNAGVAGEYFVPDSMPHTLVFFLAVIGGMQIGRLASSK